MKPRGKFHHKSRLQWTMEDQAGIALDPGDIVAVVMDAMAVEGQGRIAKQQDGIGHVAFAVLCGRRWSCWPRWRRRLRARHLPIDDILPLADRGAARRRGEMFDGYETQYAGAAGLHRHI